MQSHLQDKAQKMALNIKQNRQERSPNRGRTFSTISLTWDVYDKLDKIATDNSASLSATIAALISFYEADDAETDGE